MARDLLRSQSLPPRVVIVGGGIAGLAAAHRVVEWSRERGRAVDLTLFEAADRLGGTIQTADPHDLALAATMPRFLGLERRERSVILALWRAARRAPGDASGSSGARWSLFVTFADGMEELIRGLAARLPPGTVRLKERV